MKQMFAVCIGLAGKALRWRRATAAAAAAVRTRPGARIFPIKVRYARCVAVEACGLVWLSGRRFWPAEFDGDGFEAALLRQFVPYFEGYAPLISRVCAADRFLRASFIDPHISRAE